MIKSAVDGLEIIHRFMDRKNISPDELWIALLELDFNIAGPWVPTGDRKSVSRYSIFGQRVAQAFSQDELIRENERLHRWGWVVTNTERVIPTWWWNMPEPEQSDDDIAVTHSE